MWFWGNVDGCGFGVVQVGVALGRCVSMLFIRTEVVSRGSKWELKEGDNN